MRGADGNYWRNIMSKKTIAAQSEFQSLKDMGYKQAGASDSLEAMAKYALSKIVDFPQLLWLEGFVKLSKKRTFSDCTGTENPDILREPANQSNFHLSTEKQIIRHCSGCGIGGTFFNTQLIENVFGCLVL